MSMSCDRSANAYDLYRNLWLIGIAAAIIASIGATFGIILQKLAHNENNNLPHDQKALNRWGFLWSPRWFAGFLLLILFPVVFEAIALTFAPQSLISPLGGLTIVLNQLFAPPILGESVSNSDWVATSILFAGVVVCTVFGAHLQPDINSKNFHAYYQQPDFLIAEIFCFASIILAVFISRSQRIYSSRYASVLLAWIAGACGAQQNIAFKGFGMLLFSSLSDDKDHIETDIRLYVLLGLLICFAVLQLIFINRGIARFDAVLFLPVYSGIYITTSAVFGGIFYKEFTCFTTVEAFLFPCGVCIVGVGMVLLTRHVCEDSALNSENKIICDSSDDKGPLLMHPVFRKRGSSESGRSTPTYSFHNTLNGLFSTPLTPTILKPGSSK